MTSMASASSQTLTGAPATRSVNQSGCQCGRAAKTGIGTKRAAVRTESQNLRRGVLMFPPVPTGSGRSLLLAGDAHGLQRFVVLGELCLAGRKAVGIQQERHQVAILVRRQAAAL